MSLGESNFHWRIVWVKEFSHLSGMILLLSLLQPNIEKKNERELERRHFSIFLMVQTHAWERSLELREVTGSCRAWLRGAFDVLLFWILSHASQALMGLDPMIKYEVNQKGTVMISPLQCGRSTPSSGVVTYLVNLRTLSKPGKLENLELLIT